MMGKIVLFESKAKLVLYLVQALTEELGDLSVDALYHSARAKEVK
jgi:hypothetical protein